jgi:hypothetical protein
MNDVETYQTTIQIFKVWRCEEDNGYGGRLAHGKDKLARTE